MIFLGVFCFVSPTFNIFFISDTKKHTVIVQYYSMFHIGGYIYILKYAPFLIPG